MRKASQAVALVAITLCGTVLGWSAARAADNLSDPDRYEYAQRYTLMRINQERARAGVGRVQLDPLAGHSAKLHSDEMLAGGYLSHWDRQGLKPSRRYNLLGGYDAVGENVYYEHGSSDSLEERLDLMMQTYMDSPGHRRTILDPSYTDVGLGFALDNDALEFYATQDFIVRVGGDYSCPLTARVGETVEFSGRYDQYRYDLENVVVGYEDLPKPCERSWLMRTGSYQDGGKLFAGYTPDAGLTFQDMATLHSIDVNPKTGWFRCSATLDFKRRPGLYYLSLWLRDKRSGQPMLAATATVETTD
jgi:hypothetical protein